jgi:hypothetical protein
MRFYKMLIDRGLCKITGVIGKEEQDSTNDST